MLGSPTQAHGAPYIIVDVYMNFSQIAIVLALLCFVVVGFVVKKSSMSSYSGFTMNKGLLGWFTIAAGISMTFAGGSAILTTASIGYTFKWYALIDPIALMIGLIIVLFLYKIYESDTGTTMAELLSFDDKPLNVLIGVVTSFTFMLIVASNFVALSKLLSLYFPMVNPLLITFFVSTLVFSYVFWGGFNSVTRTDVFQYLLITIFLILPIAIFMVSNQGKLTAAEITHEYSAMPLDYIILFSIPVLFTPLSQDINIRIKSAKSPCAGKTGLLLGGVFYFSIVLSAAYVGIYLGNNNISLSDPEQAIPLFFKDHLPHVGFLCAIAVLSAIISTLDSYILNAMTSISNDIIRPFSKHGSTPSGNIKIAALITYIVAMTIALFFNKVLLLSLTSLLIYVSVLTPIALGNALQLSSRKIFLASIINIVAIVSVEVMLLPLSPKAIVYPLWGCTIMLLFHLHNYKTT